MSNYGIQNEKSDYRVHVCFKEGAVYIFERIHAWTKCQTGSYRQVSGYQSGYFFPTSQGYLVPPDDILGCLRIEIPHDIMAAVHPDKHESTSQKGRKAEQVFEWMRKRGLIPMLSIIEVDDTHEQLTGVDVKVRDDIRLQIKCDFDGGRKPNGSGNLFLQTAELNPGKHH